MTGTSNTQRPKPNKNPNMKTIRRQNLMATPLSLALGAVATSAADGS